MWAVKLYSNKIFQFLTGCQLTQVNPDNGRKNSCCCNVVGLALITVSLWSDRWSTPRSRSIKQQADHDQLCRSVVQTCIWDSSCQFSNAA